jgi:hypothetical protein
MSKYLSSGNDFSRMYGAGLQQSISPNTSNTRRGSAQNQGYNRPSSLENRYGGKINASMSSMGGMNNFATVNNQYNNYHEFGRQSQSRSGSRAK